MWPLLLWMQLSRVLKLSLGQVEFMKISGHNCTLMVSVSLVRLAWEGAGPKGYIRCTGHIASKKSKNKGGSKIQGGKSSTTIDVVRGAGDATNSNTVNFSGGKDTLKQLATCAGVYNSVLGNNKQQIATC
eukprot:7913196-Ditylum_brightwellii.AAC.1